MKEINGIFDVTNYGVFGDGQTNNTAAIKNVIDLAEKNGGGTIYFPPGEYVTGTIELKSNMTLYLSSGSVILGSADPADYPMITKSVLPGYEREGHSGLIKALKADNVTICGRGVVDGRGYNWWGQPKNEHRPRAIQPILCTNVRIEGITIINSAMWTVHPMCCENVTIDGISIKNPSNSPNTDGINPESCANVRIANCNVDVGDDCITLKSGTETDILQKTYPCRNIVITNCTMLNGHGGVVIGSEMSGGVENITISNCVFNGTDRGIRIKTRRKRGGVVKDVMISNILMTNVFAPFTVNGYYQCGGTSPDDESLFSLKPLEIQDNTPRIEGITINNVRAVGATASAGYIYGIPEMPVSRLNISNYSVDMVEAEEEIKDKPIMAYHIEKTKGEGIYCANLKNSIFTNISVNVINGPGVIIENSDSIRMTGINANTEEAVRLVNSTNVTVN